MRASKVTYDGSLPKKEWLALRKQTAPTINPETAEVAWVYGLTLDCYGVHPDLPEDLQQVGREYFARSPGSEIWVSFGDLPEATRESLWQKASSTAHIPCRLRRCPRSNSGRRRGGPFLKGLGYQSRASRSVLSHGAFHARSIDALAEHTQKTVWLQMRV
jgi:hypothetical protein